MAQEQQSLFGEEPQEKPASRELVLKFRKSDSLTKEQKAFNRLVAKVEALRRRMEEESRRLDKALAYYGEHLHPRLMRQLELRKEFVRALAPSLDDKRLKRKSEQNILREIIDNHLQEIAAKEGSLADEDLRAIFGIVHGVEFKRIQEETLDDFRSEMETMFDKLGVRVDLSGLRPDMTEEEAAAKMSEIEEKVQQRAEEAEREFQPRQRRKTKRQLEKERYMEQAEEVRKKSVASIYKQLARVLHPDLEPDAERRQIKSALMQELTAAYRNNDLHKLLRLELEWIQREEGDIERLTEEKLAIYNQVLKDQASELERELDSLAYHPRYRPLVVSGGPFGIRLRTNGPAEAKWLDLAIKMLEASVARMREFGPVEEARDIIKAYREGGPDLRLAESDDFAS